MLPLPNYLAIDQGTHATRAIVFDANGNEVAKSVVDVGLRRFGAGHVEQSAEEINASVNTVLGVVLAQCRGSVITACGLATQRSTVLGWNTDGLAVTPALSWQDVRASDTVAALSQQAEEIQRISGLPLSPHYGASKLHWLAQQTATPLADRYSPLVSYLLFHLLSDHPYVVDHCNAQRTQLFDLQQLDWSRPLCDWFKINAAALPACQPVCHPYGMLTDTEIPLTAVSGDQNAALCGDGYLEQGTARINLGTGAFVLRAMQAYRASRTQLTGIAISNADSITWMREATINGAGSALAWASESCQIEDSRQHMAGWLNEIEAPPLFINSVGGLGSPWWTGKLQPHFVGNNLSAAQRMTGVIESIIFMVNANLEIMRTESELVRLRVSGGLSNLDMLCQKLADLSGLVVERSTETEATARGIAWLAAGQPSHWRTRSGFDVFEPRYDQALQSRYDKAMEALQALLSAQEKTG